MTDPRLPDFVVLGAHRCAMRWLRFNLGEHPDIHVPPGPIDHFTDRSTERSLRTYRLEFREAGEATLIGDCSPSYLAPRNHLRNVAERMADALPDARLVALLRDPVDRMYSAFRDHVIHGRLPLDADLVRMIRTDHPDVAALDLVGSSRYAENLYPYWKRFGDRLLVLFVDDLAQDPARFMATLLDHIGARTDFEPSRLDRVLYSNAHSRWTESSIPSEEQRRVLYMLFRRDVEELEAITGRYLPAWDPGPPPSTWTQQLGLTDTYLRSDVAAG